MKSLAALTIAAILGMSAAIPATAAPVAPAGIAGALVDIEMQSGVDEVRWVQRCRMVTTRRHGQRVKVRRCGRVWVR